MCNHNGRLQKYTDGAVRCMQCESLITPSYKEQISKLQTRVTELESKIEGLRIYVNNPSAWEHYDDAMSERIGALVKLLEGER